MSIWWGRLLSLDPRRWPTYQLPGIQFEMWLDPPRRHPACWEGENYSNQGELQGKTVHRPSVSHFNCGFISNYLNELSFNTPHRHPAWKEIRYQNETRLRVPVSQHKPLQQLTDIVIGQQFSVPHANRKCYTMPSSRDRCQDLLRHYPDAKT